MSKDLWEREYAEKLISSSTNQRPSHGTEFLRRNLGRIQDVDGPRHLLDLGCGGGRNIPMLRETGLVYHGLDFAFRPLARARAAGGDHPPRLVQASVADRLPFKSEAFSLVTAFTVVENLQADEQLRALGEEIRRVLVPGGFLYVYFLTTEDTYYRPLVSVGPGGQHLTYDPATELRQRVYRLAELDELLGDPLELTASEEFVFEDTRSRGRYERHLAAGLWRRR